MKSCSLGAHLIPRDAGDFRLINHNVLDALRNLPERNRFMKGMYAWVDYKAIGIPYTPPRAAMASAPLPGSSSSSWPGLTSPDLGHPIASGVASGEPGRRIAGLRLRHLGPGKMFFHKSIPAAHRGASPMFFSGV